MIARGQQAFVAVAIATVAASVLGGLLLLGSPQKERERALDARRIADVRAIARAIDLYWTRQGRLPASLAALSPEQGFRVNLVDPETKRPYGYRVLEEKSYELCAEFARNAADEGRVLPSDFWAHGEGSQCFRLEAKALKR